jgi:hypothetical protein
MKYMKKLQDNRLEFIILCSEKQTSWRASTGALNVETRDSSPVIIQTPASLWSAVFLLLSVVFAYQDKICIAKHLDKGSDKFPLIFWWF